jgi:hypothetical protein
VRSRAKSAECEIESLLCLNGEDELWVDYHPEGALIVRKVTCKARFEKWLDD